MNKQKKHEYLEIPFLERIEKLVRKNGLPLRQNMFVFVFCRLPVSCMPEQNQNTL